MLVSWNWLKEYIPTELEPTDVETRLMMAGLNHEGTARVGDDLAIDLEVTSNRPDCLGHIGVAREVAVLFDQTLKSPAAAPKEMDPAVTTLTQISIECPELCYRYTARVIRGVRVGPSPEWLVNRLHTIGLAAVNNIVDITNYVCMENGQPLHAFDLRRLNGAQIIVREPFPEETFEAINHKNYLLEQGMCVIADAQRAVALGGVMGGADTEVSESTVDLLIEAAQFDPISVRSTARKLNLHSPSSYRFERTVDPEGIDWASRRCCELILELAGGELAEGVIDVGREPQQPTPIVLRLDQIPRILGIDVDATTVRRILVELGNHVAPGESTSLQVIPPSWRRDLTREIDLIEEVARIHGYDKIPEDTGVAMVPSHRSDEDRGLEIVRRVMLSSGFDEAMTYSVVQNDWSDALSPWTEAAPLQSSTPMLKGANCLRRSLIPSLLGARRVNETLSNPMIELFETARIYLPQNDQLPDEQLMLCIISGGDFFALKGVLEVLVHTLNPAETLTIKDTTQSYFAKSRGCELWLGGDHCGYLGEVSSTGLKQFSLRTPATVAEIRLSVLFANTDLKRQHRPQSPYPPVTRDLNLVVDEQVRWSEIRAAVHHAGGKFLEDILFHEPYRDPDKDGPNKKRLLFSVTFRSLKRTLTGEEVDACRQDIVEACQRACGATLID